MDPNLKKYTGSKELFLKKATLAVICSVLSNLLVVFLFITIINFNAEPLKWLASTLHTFASFSTWFYLLAFIVTIIAQIAICGRKYILEVSYPLTRFQKFISVFSVRTFILAVLHIIVGALMVLLYLALISGQNDVFYRSCTNRRYCLIEGNFLSLLGGMWIGCYYFAYINVSAQDLVFPIIQQHKLLFFKSQFLSLVNKSRRDAFYPTLYYFIFYIAFGRSMRNGFANMFNIHVEDGHLDLWLFKYSWFFSVLYILNMHLMHFFFKLYLMEPIEHPLISKDGCGTLGDAVLLNVPILQHLACLDLYLLSNWSLERRKLLFTLSQPGGHPYTWNYLFRCTLNLLTTYNDNLNYSINLILKEEQPNVTSGFNNMVIEDFQNSIQVQQKHANIRNMSMSPIVQPQNNIVYTEIVNQYVSPLENFKKNIMSIPIIAYLFGELPEAYLEYYLQNGQLIIWASQGLANLAVASVHEDPYGVIQKDLPLLITSLVNLKICLERLNTLHIFARKKSNSEDFNFKMKNSLNAGVKRSICNICKTFGKYFPDIPLEKQVVDYLKCYL